MCFYIYFIPDRPNIILIRKFVQNIYLRIVLPFDKSKLLNYKTIKKLIEKNTKTIVSCFHLIENMVFCFAVTNQAKQQQQFPGLTRFFTSSHIIDAVCCLLINASRTNQLNVAPLCLKVLLRQ